MKSSIQYHISKGDGWYVATGVDVPVVTQGRTINELKKNIREATELTVGR